MDSKAPDLLSRLRGWQILLWFQLICCLWHLGVGDRSLLGPFFSVEGKRRSSDWEPLRAHCHLQEAGTTAGAIM